MPTLLPAKKRVPRCRTRIEPAVTRLPSYRLTPSRLAWLSRPLRELPTPFLCAILLLQTPCALAPHCHGREKLGDDLLDDQAGELLPVAGLLAIARLRLHLEDDQLRPLDLPLDVGEHARALDDRGADADARLVRDHEHAVEGDLRAGFARQLLDLDHIAGRDPVLFAARFHDCVHRVPLLVSMPLHFHCRQKRWARGPRPMKAIRPLPLCQTSPDRARLDTLFRVSVEWLWCIDLHRFIDIS